MARLCEVNNYLPLFPDMADPPANTKLPEDEIKDIAECALLHKLQRHIRLQGFDVAKSSVEEFISLVKRLEILVSEDTE